MCKKSNIWSFEITNLYSKKQEMHVRASKVPGLGSFLSLHSIVLGIPSTRPWSATEHTKQLATELYNENKIRKS